MNCKYSIIVPVYNVALYIERCVKSVMKQSYENWELLLIDDGSTDNSLEICKRLCKTDNRIKCYHKQNGGVSSARNFGIDKANGQYVTFLDADDYWLTKNVLDQVEKQSNTDVLYVNQLILEYPSGKRKNFQCCPVTGKQLDKESIIPYFTAKLLNGGWACYNIIVLKEIIDRAQIRMDETIKIGEDADFFFRILLEATSVGFIDYPFYAYCIYRQGSAMQKKSYSSIMTLFTLISKWNVFATEDSKDAQLVRDLLCNNLLNYFPVFGLYPFKHRCEIANTIIASRVLDHINNRKAEKVKRIRKVIILQGVLWADGIIYRIKSVLRMIVHKFIK